MRVSFCVRLKSGSTSAMKCTWEAPPPSPERHINGYRVSWRHKLCLHLLDVLSKSEPSIELKTNTICGKEILWGPIFRANLVSTHLSRVQFQSPLGSPSTAVCGLPKNSDLNIVLGAIPAKVYRLADLKNSPILTLKVTSRRYAATRLTMLFLA